MSEETVNREIESEAGTLQVRVTPMGVMRRTKMLPKLGGIFAAALSRTEGVDQLEDVSKLAPALQALCEQLDEGQIVTLAQSLFYGVSIGHPVIGNTTLENEKKIDTAFGGDLVAMFSVLALSLEVNFGNFIERAKRALMARFAKKLPAAPSAADSTASSSTSQTG